MPAIARGLKKQRIEGAEDRVETSIKNERKKPGSFGSRTIFASNTKNKNDSIDTFASPKKDKYRSKSNGNKDEKLIRQNKKRRKIRKNNQQRRISDGRKSRKMRRKNYENENTLSAILRKGLRPNGQKIKNLSLIAKNLSLTDKIYSIAKQN